MNKFLGWFGVFSGIWETENGKSKYIFEFEGLQGLPLWLSLWGGGRAHLVAGGRGCSCYFADVSKNEQNPLLPSFCCFCSWRVACKYGSISRFKGVFSEVWGFCVGLFVLALFVACGAFVCVSG